MKKMMSLLISFVMLLSIFIMPVYGETTIIGNISNQVVLNQNNVKITLTNTEQDSYRYMVNFIAENTSSKDYIIQVRDVSVNGWMIEPICSAEVVKGKSIRSSFAFLLSDFKDNGITQVSKIEFKFYIFNQDDWGDNFESSTITVSFNNQKPASSSTTSSQNYTENVTKGTVVNQNGVVITITGTKQDSYFYAITFTAENKSSKNYTIQTRNVSVNNWMIEPTCSSDVQAGKKVNDTITFFSSDLERNNIKNLSQVELNFYIFNQDNWEDAFETSRVSVKFTKSSPKAAINKTKATIYATKTVTLKIKNNTAKVTWKSSNKKIATVSKAGVVKGIKKGKVTITAKANGQTYKCIVTVKNPTLKLNKTKCSIKVKKTITIKATATPKGTVKWKTSNKKIATVTSKGVIKGVKKGKVTISATVNGVTKKVEVTIK